jgi:hypothetical protein
MFLSLFGTLLLFTLEELATAALMPFSDRRRTAPLAVPGQFRLGTRAMPIASPLSLSVAASPRRDNFLREHNDFCGWHTRDGVEALVRLAET